MIVYAVIKNEWEYEYDQPHSEVVKCFTDLKKAEEYMEMLQYEENDRRFVSEKCQNCSGSDRSCPLWQETFEDSDECGAWYDNAYQGNVDYEITDIELVED